MTNESNPEKEPVDSSKTAESSSTSSEANNVSVEEAKQSIGLEQGTTKPSQEPPQSTTSTQQATSPVKTDDTSQTQQPVRDTSTAMPAIADDTDLIEKEWVIKAKHIVEQTKGDPYLQTNEVSKVKAEYIKKRYNKEIKTG